MCTIISPKIKFVGDRETTGSRSETGYDNVETTDPQPVCSVGNKKKTRFEFSKRKYFSDSGKVTEIGDTMVLPIGLSNVTNQKIIALPWNASSQGAVGIPKATPRGWWAGPWAWPWAFFQYVWAGLVFFQQSHHWAFYITARFNCDVIKKGGARTHRCVHRVQRVKVLLGILGDFLTEVSSLKNTFRLLPFEITPKLIRW